MSIFSPGWYSFPSTDNAPASCFTLNFPFAGVFCSSACFVSSTSAFAASGAFVASVFSASFVFSTFGASFTSAGGVWSSTFGASACFLASSAAFFAASAALLLLHIIVIYKKIKVYVFCVNLLGGRFPALPCKS